MTFDHTRARAEQFGSADGTSRRTKPSVASLLKVNMRAVVKLRQQRPREKIALGVFYVGLGDRFDDDRRRVPDHRCQDQF
jgi:hypothetical protein